MRVLTMGRLVEGVGEEVIEKAQQPTERL